MSERLENMKESLYHSDLTPLMVSEMLDEVYEQGRAERSKTHLKWKESLELALDENAKLKAKLAEQPKLKSTSYRKVTVEELYNIILDWQKGIESRCVSSNFIVLQSDRKELAQAVVDYLNRKVTVGEILNLLPSYEEAVDEYELRADNGDYTPSEHEKMLMLDFLIGYIEESSQAIVDYLNGEVGE